ncbi:hypothetical protein SAMN05216359_10382 [Roseateles sp. YR242]|nr:hypothetical protein SAMN05216359_10382 [Roseateles sp. YR242]
MPAFWKPYDKGRALDSPQRVERLMSEFFEPNAAAYRLAGLTVTPQRVRAWLPKFDGMSDAARLLHRAFAAIYETQQGHFTQALPDSQVKVSPVWLMPSLFTFDAHLEPQGPGQPLPLFFAPDGILRFHGVDADLAVLFAHEWFHCYHALRAPLISLDPKPGVHEALWVEGLATYASQQLHPEATLTQVLLDDAALAATPPAVLQRAARAMLDVWESQDPAASTPFLDMGYRGDWPPRVGYYAGLLAAQQLGQRTSLQVMAGWDRGDLSHRLRPVIESLSKG